jgi:hypothetical protein
MPSQLERGTRSARQDAMKTSVVLAQLIRACVDDERTLQSELRFVTPGHAGTLIRLAHEREQFVGELEQLEPRTQPRSGGSWSELVREAGRSLAVKAAGRNHGDSIASCRRSRARVEASYDRALDTVLPDEVRRVLVSHRSHLVEETMQLNQLQF